MSMIETLSIIPNPLLDPWKLLDSRDDDSEAGKMPNDGSGGDGRGNSKWTVRGLRGGFPQERMKIWFSKTQKSFLSVGENGEKQQEHVDSQPQCDNPDLSRKMAHWNAATHDQQLLWIVESEVGMRLFEAFMKSTYSEESLYFWLDVGKFAALTDEFEMKKEYHRIVETYLREGCPYQVNLPHYIYDHVMLGTKDPQAITPTVLESARSDIFSLMKFDSLARFKETKEFRTLLESHEQTA